MGKSRKDYEKFLNSISPDRDDEAWIIGGKKGFYHCNDAGTLPGECADFIFHKCND